MQNFDPQGGPIAPPNEAEIAKRHSFVASKKRKFAKVAGYILLFVTVAAAVAFGVITYLTHKGKKPNVAAPTTAVVAPVEVKNDIPESTAIKPYENGVLGLKLSYPDTWKVTETADKGVRIESPAFTFTTLDKGDVLGKFRLYVRKGARASDGKIIGRGVAVQPSEKLTYTQPAPDQRKDTLLTLFGLDTKDNFGFLMIAGNFQLKAGDTLGPKYGSEPDAFIVGGGFSDDTLTDDLATHTMPLNVVPTSRAYAQAVSILKTLQLR